MPIGVLPELPKKATKAQEDLLALYAAAMLELQRILDGYTVTASRSARVDDELREIEAIVAALNVEIAGDTEENALSAGIIPAYYAQGVALGLVSLTAQGLDVNTPSNRALLSAEAVAASTDQMTLDLLRANISMGQSSSGILRQTQQTVLSERAINRAIAQGLIDGAPEQVTSLRIQRQIEDAINNGRFVRAGSRNFTPENYAKMVTRTRTAEARTLGTINAGIANGVTLYQVSFHPDTDSLCASFAGRIFSLVPGTKFPLLVERPPFHPNCVLPDTEVFCPDIKSASIATYSGPVIDIRLSNSGRFSVTPNHMFLTPNGFVFAKDLSEGDDILCSGIFEDVCLSDPNNNDRPSTISEKFVSFSKSSGMSSTTVPVSPEDFHSDARGFNGEVNIVGPDSLLRNGLDAVEPQEPTEATFSNSDIRLFSLAGCGHTASLLKGLFLATNSIMGRGRELQAILRGKAKPSSTHRVTTGAFADPSFTENEVYDSLAAIEGDLEVSDTLPIQVSLANFITRKGITKLGTLGDAPLLEPSIESVVRDPKFKNNNLDFFPGDVRITNIVFKGIRSYCGHVYDLQSESSLYICGGAISSNCLHLLFPFTPAPGDDLDALAKTSHRTTLNTQTKGLEAIALRTGAQRAADEAEKVLAE